MKKAIIILTGNFPFGGPAANYVRNFAKCLSANYGVEVLLPKGYFFGDVPTLDKHKVNFFENIKYRYLNVIKQPKHSVARLISNGFGVFKLYVYLLWLRFKGPVDCIFVYDIFLHTNLLTLLVCRLTGAKLVNIIPEYYPDVKEVGLVKVHNALSHAGMRFLVRYCNGVIVLSTFLADLVRKYGFRGELLLLPGIVDPSIFSRAVAVSDRSNITIGYCGTPTAKDGIEDLLESFALVHQEFASAKLLIIGDTPRLSSIERLRLTAQDLGIGDSVAFSGLVSMASVVELLRTCDILVLARPTSVQAEAGFPSKLGEYFAAGKAVVATRVGDLERYFAGQEIVELVKPNDVKSISEGIIRLIEDEKRRCLLAKNGHEWMSLNLSMDSVRQRLAQYLDRVLS